jgi:hypothetical protein
VRDFKWPRVASGPAKSWKEADKYAAKLLAESSTVAGSLAAEPGSVGTAAYTDMDGYITSKLNSQELALYRSNLAKALLCLANGKLALDYAKQYYQDSCLHNGNGDAFRHCLWNYGMTIDVGAAFAKKWSDAHEYGTTGQPLIERQMDLYNNQQGINLGVANPWTIWHSTFISKSRQKCRDGALKRIVNSKVVASSNACEK